MRHTTITTVVKRLNTPKLSALAIIRAADRWGNRWDTLTTRDTRRAILSEELVSIQLGQVDGTITIEAMNDYIREAYKALNAWEEMVG